jgi:hypothetical protein
VNKNIGEYKMPHRKTILSVPPSFVEVEQLARYYAKGKGIPFSSFVWQAVENYLRDELGEEELPAKILSELDRIEAEMDQGSYTLLQEMK